MINLKINNVSADLYKDETIKVNSKVKDAQELGKIFTDFSTSFTLPATNGNNKIFRHFHNEGVVVTTDFRLSQDASIEIDTIPFRQGQIRLESVQMKNNRPYSYSVKFLGNGVNIKRAVGDALLSDLILADYNHTRTPAIVRAGLAAGENWNGLDDSIIYPLVTKSIIDWNTTSLGLDTSGITSDDFHPAIKVNKVLDEIAYQYGLQFDSDYWASTAFDNLYLWCPVENNNDESPTDGDTKVLLTFASSTGFDTGVNIGESQIQTLDWGSLTNQTFYISLSTGSSVPYKLYVEKKVGGSWVVAATYDYPTGGNLSETYSTGFDLATFRFRIEPDTSITVNLTIQGEVSDTEGGSGGIYYVYGTSSQVIDDADAQLRYRMPKMKITDFLTGVLQLSNCVMIPTGSGSFYVEPYDTWRAAGKLIDLTKYFDAGQVGVNAVPLPSEINMMYKDPKAANNKFYKEYNGFAYGDRVNQATGGEGSPYEIKLPFENLLFDKQSDSNLLIGKSVEATEKSTELKPIQDRAYLFYFAGTQSGVDIDVADWTSPITNYKVVNTFYPIGTPTDSLNFGEQVNPFDGVETAGVGIYFAHYANLMNSIFNPQYRLFKMTAILPASVLNSIGIDALAIGELESSYSINLNDTIQIGDRFFNIEEMSVEINSRKTSLTLSNLVINDDTFDDGIDRIAPTAPVLDYVPNPDVTAPVIGTLTWASETTTTVSLTWAAATDDGTITNYKVFKDGALYATLGNVLSTTVTGLTQNTGYSFWITAVDDSANESGVSNTVTGTTDVALPLPVITSPTIVTFSEVSESTYQITATNTPNKYKATGLPFFMSFNSTTGIITDNNYPSGSDDSPYSIQISASNDGGGTYGAEKTLTINY